MSSIVLTEASGSSGSIAVTSWRIDGVSSDGSAVVRTTKARLRVGYWRSGAYAIEHCVVERGDLRDVGISRLRQRQLERQQPLGREPCVLLLEPQQTLHHQAGADEEHEREGNLDDNERAAGAADAAAAASAV